MRSPGRIRLTWYDAPRAPRAGERWQFEVRLRQRRGFANPGGFDYEGQLFRERVGATGYVRASSANRYLDDGRWQPLLELRARIVARMRGILGSSTAGGVLIGLAVGDTSAIDSQTWRVFSATGTTHLVAISGLHITMIATFAMLLSRVAWRIFPGRVRGARADTAAFCGALAALGYSLLAGFSVPTQRTLMMLCVALCATLLRRAQPPSHVLAASLLGVLLIDPHSALTPGFWLSFLAVAAILMVARSGQGLRSYARSFVATQAAVTVLLLPATVALFGSFSMVAPLANLLAIPLFTIVLVPGTLLGLALLWPLAQAGEALLRLAARILELTWPALEMASRMPAALLHPANPTCLLMVCLLLSGIAVLTVFPLRLRLLSLVLLLPLVDAGARRPPEGSVDITVLDVGQGLSVLVETRTHALLYDAGPLFRSGRSAGEFAVAPLLHHRGIRHLDMLVVSHDDLDHAGGVAAVEREVTIAARRGASGGRSAVPCRRGEAWMWDAVRFEFLHPATQESWDDNNGSCVLRVTGAGGSVLLTGDIEQEAENWLVARKLLAASDVVVVAHHGSRSSSAGGFVAGSAARLAVVSAGHGNRWSFPHVEVVQRWCAAGARVIDTASWGAIRVRIDRLAGLQEARGFRGEYRRFWHARVRRPPASRCGAIVHPP